MKTYYCIIINGTIPEKKTIHEMASLHTSPVMIYFFVVNRKTFITISVNYFDNRENGITKPDK